jgi:hypothetical protein
MLKIIQIYVQWDRPLKITQYDLGTPTSLPTQTQKVAKYNKFFGNFVFQN